MQKLVKYAVQLAALKKGNTPKISQSPEFKNLMSCFPIRVDKDLLLKSFPRTIGISTLYSDDDLRISAYFLPKGLTMPLHDHPNMFVLGMVLHGIMQAKLYTKLGGMTYKKSVQVLKQNEFTLIQGETHNMHEFHGLQHTLFLDILTPDYDHVNRICTHYKEVPGTQKGDQVKLQVDEDVDYQMVEL